MKNIIQEIFAGVTNLSKVSLDQKQTMRVWMKRKEQPRNAMKRIGDTLNEYRKLRHSDSPKVPAVSMASPLSRLVRPVWSEQGDTIVEVMISMAILSLALAIAYTLSTASLHNGLESNQRTEALALAQAQVNLLTGAKNNDASFASDYQINAPYCINLDASKNTTVGSDQLCDGFNSTPYNIGVSYNSTTGVFTITSKWSSPNAPGGTSNLNLYYKLPGLYTKALINTGAASNITNTSATFSGSVDPNGNGVQHCYFEYGTTTSYGATADCSPGSLGSGTSYISVSANVSGLTPGALYHFNLCAKNSVNITNCGIDQTFTTADKPIPTTSTTTSIGQNSATFNGNVNPNGSALVQNNTGCYFQFGTSAPAYGSSVVCSTIPGGTSGDPAVTAPTGSVLTQNTVYHFRLCATNIAGTGCSSDTTFTTAPAVPIANISASPTSVSYGNASTLSWSSSYASYCTASGNWSGTVATSGSTSTGGLTSSSYTYYLNCSGPGGTSPTVSATVYVSSPPPPPPPAEAYLCQDAYFDGYGSCWGPFPSGFQCNAIDGYTDGSTSSGCSSIPNDQISGFQAQNGVMNIAIYWDWHFSGDCANFSSNNGWVGDDWNDQLSSFKVGSYC